MITEGQTEKQGTNTPTPRRDSPEGGPLKQQDHNSQAGFCDPPIPAVLTLSQTHLSVFHSPYVPSTIWTLIFCQDLHETSKTSITLASEIPLDAR